MSSVSIAARNFVPASDRGPSGAYAGIPVELDVFRARWSWPSLLRLLLEPHFRDRISAKSRAKGRFNLDGIFPSHALFFVSFRNLTTIGFAAQLASRFGPYAAYGAFDEGVDRFVVLRGPRF